MAARPRRITSVRLWLLLTACVWLAAAVLLVLRWHMIERPGPPLKEVFPYGELRIGVDASNPPFAVATENDLFGLEIDLGRALAGEINIPLRFVNMTFDGLYDSLKADQVDMVIATLSIDSLRTAEVRYTRPYFNAGLVLVSPPDRPPASMSDLPGHALAYEFGSNAHSWARRWLRRVAYFETQPYELPEHALDAVRLRQADLALVDATTARLYTRQHPGWQPHLQYVADSPYVIATRFDRASLWAAVDKALQALIEDGRLTAIIDEWL